MTGAVRIALGAGAALLLAGCATTPAAVDPERLPAGVAGQCEADALQARLGTTATAAVGAELFAASGAARLRWMPPRTAVTMDYRADRLNIAYDDGMTITRISCG